MKKSKTAKSVVVNMHETRGFISEYHCPVCLVTFRGGISIQTTRFRCECGQELSIKKREYSYIAK